jgi:hypothetical protein
LLDQPVGAGVKKPLHYSGEPDIFMHAIRKRIRSKKAIIRANNAIASVRAKPKIA